MVFVKANKVARAKHTNEALQPRFRVCFKKMETISSGIFYSVNQFNAVLDLVKLLRELSPCCSIKFYKVP